MSSDIEGFRKKFNKELKAGLLTLLVLQVIDRGSQPSYGYAIIKALETASEGRFKFPEGTVYPILSSLASMGLLESHWGDSAGGPRRKYYRLTTRGREARSACLEDWRALMSVTDDIIGVLGVSE